MLSAQFKQWRHKDAQIKKFETISDSEYMSMNQKEAQIDKQIQNLTNNQVDQESPDSVRQFQNFHK